MVKYRSFVQNGEVINHLEMKEWDDLIQCFIPQKPATSWKKTKAVKKFIAFIDWYLAYATNRLGSVSYKMEPTVIDILPLKQIKSDTGLKNYYRHLIYLLREYAMKIKTEIKPSTVIRYSNEAFMLGTQMDLCICAYETLLSPAIPLTPHSYSSQVLSLRDIFWAANALNNIEAIPNIADLYVRDIKPNVIFQIRQLIELLGNRVLGFSSIKNASTHESIHKFTQIAWEFLMSNNGKRAWRIDFQIRQDVIFRINKWSNRFVHSGVFTPPYIQFFLLKVFDQLMKPPKASVTIYDGTPKHSVEFGEIYIYHYDSLKVDFQTFIDNKMGGPGRATVDWLPIELVAAYIISL